MGTLKKKTSHPSVSTIAGTQRSPKSAMTSPGPPHPKPRRLVEWAIGFVANTGASMQRGAIRQRFRVSCWEKNSRTQQEGKQHQTNCLWRSSILGRAHTSRLTSDLRIKNRYPKWNPGKWKHGLKPGLPWWFNFDPYPYLLQATSEQRRLCLVQSIRAACRSGVVLCQIRPHTKIGSTTVLKRKLVYFPQSCSEASEKSE